MVTGDLGCIAVSLTPLDAALLPVDTVRSVPTGILAWLKAFLAVFFPTFFGYNDHPSPQSGRCLSLYLSLYLSLSLLYLL